MDITTLVQTVTTFLVPFLPHLIKMGEQAAESAAKKLGEDAWNQAKRLWGKLAPKVKEKPSALEAVQDIVETPDDEDVQASFRLQLKKLLSEDDALAREIEHLVQEGKQAGIIVVASGDRSVAVGRSVSHTIITTGDKNKIKFNDE